MAKIEACVHCGSYYTTALKDGLCKSCKTKEQRAEMDEKNKEIFEKVGQVFKCNYCFYERSNQAKKKLAR